MRLVRARRFINVLNQRYIWRYLKPRHKLSVSVVCLKSCIVDVSSYNITVCRLR